MNEKNANHEDSLEPVCEPSIIRCEATFHPAPGFEYMNETTNGESEPCLIEPVISVQMEFKPSTEGSATSSKAKLARKATKRKPT
jgi:hypothetical protein